MQSPNFYASACWFCFCADFHGRKLKSSGSFRMQRRYGREWLDSASKEWQTCYCIHTSKFLQVNARVQHSLPLHVNTLIRKGTYLSMYYYGVYLFNICICAGLSWKKRLFKLFNLCRLQTCWRACNWVTQILTMVKKALSALRRKRSSSSRNTIISPIWEGA